MITYEDVVRRYADEWRNLISWRAPLPAAVKLVPYKNTKRLGFAKSYKCEARVYLTGKTAKSLARDLATLLHELAHLAAPNQEHHGLQWREIFAAATVEALKLRAAKSLGGDGHYDLEVSITDLDAQVEASILSWLNRTGTVAVLRAVGAIE